MDSFSNGLKGQIDNSELVESVRVANSGGRSNEGPQTWFQMEGCQLWEEWSADNATQNFPNCTFLMVHVQSIHGFKLISSGGVIVCKHSSDCVMAWQNRGVMRERSADGAIGACAARWL